MSTRSQNVLDYPNENTVFLVWTLRENAPSLKRCFQRVCALMSNINNSANVRFPNTRASVVMAISYHAWELLGLPMPMPKELQPFREIRGRQHTAVATEGDLHFHIRSDEKSFCMDTVYEISVMLRDIADCVEEVHGFKYWDSRSVLGFVDGTENPQEADRAHFGLVGDEDPAYKGGSYLFVQKYLHDLTAWRALPESEQERVIGRSKGYDIEMADDVKPSNSHSALANVGDDLKIVRDNLPFGNMATNEMGTYFIAYASTFSTIQKMLTRMFIGEPGGNYDRILDFSTPHTGTLFFAPTFNMLADFAG